MTDPLIAKLLKSDPIALRQKILEEKMKKDVARETRVNDIKAFVRPLQSPISESTLSSILGALVVFVVGILLFNYFKGSGI